MGTTLITGGRGFVGTNLVKQMSGEHRLRVFDSLERSSPTGWEPDAAEMVVGNILDAKALGDAMGSMESVVHLAAYGSVVESVSDPLTNFTANVQGTFNVLKAALDAQVGRVIFASTGGALIGDATPPVSEESLPKPISPYGASKLCGEAYAHAFAKASGLHTTCLRFGNVYGPHSAHKKGAVTLFIKALMRDQPIVIYGDGSASRDYIHVEDLCAGISAALGAESPAGEVYHLASRRETTVLELARTLRDIAGKPVHPIEFRPARAGEVARNFARCDKAESAFGFRSRWTLQDGLAATWEWFSALGDQALQIETSDS
ncbi:MAG TPA: epimerase [Gammaproteobacteria bacterium]|nr:epimerase [Gammaproteobacteria bacterium]